MASPFLQGFQVGASTASDALNRNLRLQELKSQQQLRMLQEQQLVQQMAIQAEARNLAIQERADMTKAITAAQAATQPFVQVPMEGQEGLGDMNPPIMEVPNPQAMTQEQAAMNFVLPVIAKYRPDKVGDFLQDVALAEYRKKTNQFTPTSETVTLPQSGRQIEGIRTSPNTFTPVISPEIETIRDPNTGRDVSVLRTGTSGAKVMPQDIQRRQLTAWALKSAPELMEIDENGNVSLPPQNFNEAARRAGIPAGTKTDMMQQMAATAGAFEVGRKLLPLLTPENVGVRGFIGRRLEEQGLAQLFPGMRIGSATETLAVASNFRAGLVRALRSDSNINKDEREQIIEGLPTPENMLSSVQDSKIKLATQLELAAIKSRAAANTLGKPITPFFLKIDEIEQMVQSGSITPEEGAKMWNANAWNLVEIIRNDVQR